MAEVPAGPGGTAGTPKPSSDPVPSGGSPAESGSEAAPDTITATKGQYFCEFAAQKGFRNCEKWRAVNPDLADRPNLEEGDEVIVPEKEEGATADKDKAEVESVRVDFPPASVRFVGQNSSLGDRTKSGLTKAGISNYQTDKAGLNDNGHTHDFFKDEPAEDEAGRNSDEDEVTTWNDPDHFRIEVHDVTAGKKDVDEVTVELQVLQPLYKRKEDGGKTKVARDEESRPDPDAPKGFRIPTNTDRKIEALKCVRVGETNYYRSKYLRLVTEKKDKIDGHTVFVGDYYQDEGGGGGGGGGAPGADDGGPSTGAIVGGAVAGGVVAGGVAAVVVTQTDNELSDTEKGAIIGGAAVAGAVTGGLIGAAASSGDEPETGGVPAKAPAVATPPTPEEKEDTRRYGEILDQEIRVRYGPKMCTDQKCLAEQTAKVGDLKNEVRLAIHIMDGCVSYEDVRRVVYGQVRRVYAAVGLRPHLMKIFKHPAVENMILLGRESGTGLNALGTTGVAGTGGAAAPQSRIKVKIKGEEITLNLTAGQKISAVTTALKSKIEGFRKDGSQMFWTRAVERPTQGVLAATEEASQYILVFENADLTTFAKVDQVDENDKDFSAGNPSLSSADLGGLTHEDEGHEHTLLKAACKTQWFDGIVLKSFDTSGTSTLFGVATWLFKKKYFPPAFLVASGNVTPDPHDIRYTFSHEMGHVIMNCAHCTKAVNKEQLMIKGAHAAGDAFDMPGRRRIMDKPMKVPYQVAKADGTFLGSSAGGWLTEIDGSTALLATASDRCHQFMPGVMQSFGAPTDREPGGEW